MESTITLTAYQFAHLIDRVLPHVGRENGYGPIQGIRLDYDGHHLHAVGTDRYTLAVARQKVHGTGKWATSISGSNAAANGNALDTLSTWLGYHQGDDNITVTAGSQNPGGTLTVASYRGTFTLAAYDGDFPDWRGLIRTAMQNPAGEQPPYAALDSFQLARWQQAGRDVRAWQSTASKPLVVIAKDFVGVQMPTRYTGDGDAPNISADLADWADSLGTGDAIEMNDTLSTWEPQELEERDNVIGQQAESLLKLTLRSTGDLFNIATGDTGALTAYALAGTQSWMAYRLLKALQKADPDLLRTVLAETSDELESGEIGEWAWDEATNAGHDPQAWHDDYEAHLKRLAAEKNAA